MRHIWSVLCRQATVDKATNNLSLLDVVEQLNVRVGSPKPGYMVPFESALVSLWSRDDLAIPETHFARLRLRAPDGSITEGSTLKVNLMQTARSRWIARHSTIPITTSGLYEFLVEVQNDQTQEWHQVASTPLQVIISVTAAIATEGPSTTA